MTLNSVVSIIKVIGIRMINQSIRFLLCFEFINKKQKDERNIRIIRNYNMIQNKGWRMNVYSNAYGIRWVIR